MHTVFRICEIKLTGENHCLFQVKLTLTGDNDKNLRVITNRIRQETFPDSEGWYRLTLVLPKVDQSDKAEKIYQILLEQTSEENEIGRINNQLEWANDNLGKCKEAITFYEKSFEIQQQSLPPNHPDLATSYNNIGNVHSKMGEYSEARSFYERAVDLGQVSLPANHPRLQIYRNNLENAKKNL